MGRSADHTIQGFLYQFNKTLLEIINSCDGTGVTVEGIVEDIDVETHSGTRAIQCKYHEAQQSFTLSLIYKPLLQMMVHFKAKPEANISYVLYGYFPDQTPGHCYPLTKEDIQQVISTKNKDYLSYATSLKEGFDDAGFLSAVTVEFGKSMDELIEDVQAALVAEGVAKDDVELISYPNAINHVANVACKHDATERVVHKGDLLAKLHGIRTIAITRWTLALRTRAKLLTAKRSQLKPHIGINSRHRYFLISHDSVEDFDSAIVHFVADYLDRYHFKLAHIKTPLFCLDCTEEVFSDIRLRLHHKGIIVEDGLVGDFFDESRFFRDPMVQRLSNQEIKREFHMRLVRYGSQPEILNRRKSDDLFIIGDRMFPNLDTQDVCVEQLAVSSLKEARYLIGVSNDYE